MELANKAFGFTPEYTLWGISYQMLNSMIMEAGYRNKRENKLEDENGEYEWIDLPQWDGSNKRTKKYKDPKVV